MNIQIQARQYTSAAEMIEAAKDRRKRIFDTVTPQQLLIRAKEEIIDLKGRLKQAEAKISERDRELESAKDHVIDLNRVIDFLRGELDLGRTSGSPAAPQLDKNPVIFKPRSTVREICREVLTHYPGLNFSDIIGPSRDPYIIEARHVCVFEVKVRRPDLSFPAIGRAFNRDHTTILHSYKKMLKLKKEADGATA